MINVVVSVRCLRYFDPQYFLRQQLTTASDVYSYGVVLLELVTGQKAIDHERVAEFNLVEWVKEPLTSLVPESTRHSSVLQSPLLHAHLAYMYKNKKV